MEKIYTGVIKWFSGTRGYGFVTIDDNQDAEYFVHFTSIVMDGYKTLKAGQKVEFELKQTDKGVQAVNVKPV